MAAWPVDLTAEVPCWRGKRSVRQLRCEWEGAYLICEVSVRTVPVESIRGLVCIRREAFEALPADREARDSVLRKKFSRYVCRLRPRSRFVFELRALGPVIINWPF